MNLDKDTLEKLESLKEDVQNAVNAGLDIRVVEPDQSKGFGYPYLLYIHKEVSKNSTLAVDCLNNCDEEPLENDTTENKKAIEDIYKIFDKFREKNESDVKEETNNKKEEDYDKTYKRMVYRMFRGTNAMANLAFSKMPNAPVMIPMLAEYPNMEHENMPQELGIGVVNELGPQIKAMIQDAQSKVEEKLQRPINDKIFMYGHSQSSTFGDRFSCVYPDMIEGLELRWKFLFCFANRKYEFKNCRRKSEKSR